MTDIRLSRPEEIPAQKRLWKTAFGDDDAFIDWFYDCRGRRPRRRWCWRTGRWCLC